ncbi:type II toxin-antitoxin system ParD family antitoxin [Prosthecomicrobium hirschii]|uniref:type II toxin-antitoxin system ParD family antitoxin n=1 Tax=Prosthecodimorpha hirschii TaxID=665126 RepID=UPI00221F749F|nr:type II toxin-antitoxin system ParD family antitoxin [Prosthecomicrobium hirschii]MCW1840311.1 type II toxin-antitoxin system ParD family antitoxin [Prosthecomicrobium hirschii]
MTMTVSLGDDLVAFVERRIARGRNASSEEVVREALKLMASLEREEEAQLSSLKASWREGLESGEGGEIDFSALKAEARARLTGPAR